MKKDNRGGKREGAGAPKKGNVQYKRNIKPEHVKLMDDHLNNLKNGTTSK